MLVGASIPHWKPELSQHRRHHVYRTQQVSWILGRELCGCAFRLIDPTQGNIPANNHASAVFQRHCAELGDTLGSGIQRLVAPPTFSLKALPFSSPVPIASPDEITNTNL